MTVLLAIRLIASLSDKKAWDWHEAIAPPTMSNWFLGFIGIGGIIAAVFTLCSIKGQGRLMLLQARISQRQAEIMARQMQSVAGKERPRIAIKLEDPTFDEGIGIVAVTIDCQCPTPAFIAKAEGESYIDAGELPRVPSYMPLPLPGQIHVTTQIEGHFPAYFGNRIATIDINLIRSKKLFIYCRGIIRYRGVHLTKDDWPYKTTFSKKWVAEEFPIPGLGDGYWEDYPNAEANRQT